MEAVLIPAELQQCVWHFENGLNHFILAIIEGKSTFHARDKKLYFFCINVFKVSDEINLQMLWVVGILELTHRTFLRENVR